MAQEKTKATGSGIGFFGMLAILFIGLKLGEVGIVATWSWWWVLSPLWLPLAVVLGVFALVFVGYILKLLLFR